MCSSDLREVLSQLVDSDDGGLEARNGATVSTDVMRKAGLSPREIQELSEKLLAPERPDFELDLTRMRSAEVVAAEMYEAVPSDFD